MAGLPGILSGRVTATEVLFPKGSPALVEPVYADGPGAEHAPPADGRRGGRRRPALTGGERPLRIIEIGAGTGSATRHVLAAAPRRLPTAYRYTDVAGLPAPRRSQPPRPRHALRAAGHRARPHHLGFEPHCADVVLATNVLHATRDIGRALANVRTLLRPVGCSP